MHKLIESKKWALPLCKEEIRIHLQIYKNIYNCKQMSFAISILMFTFTIEIHVMYAGACTAQQSA